MLYVLIEVPGPVKFLLLSTAQSLLSPTLRVDVCCWVSCAV